jgi:PAS domain S-box-containing protein
MGRLFDKSVLLGIALIVALLIANAGLAYRNIWRLNEDAKWVAHTHEVLDATDGVLLTLVDAETGQRGFLFTGQDEYLQPYDAALSRLDALLAQLKDKTNDNIRQRNRLRRLQEMIATELALLRQGIDLRRNNADHAQLLLASQKGKEQMDAIRDIVTDTRQEEERLLKDRERQSRRAYDLAVTTGILTAVLGLLMVGAFLVLLGRSLAMRHKTAALIQEQRELLRTTLASIGDAVITTDAQGQVTSLNPAADSLTGWSQEEAESKPLEVVFPIVNEKTRQPAEDPARRALREGTVVGLANHTLLLRRDGKEIPIDDSAAPIRSEAGKVAGVVLVFRDVSERRRAEKSLRQSEARLRLFVEHCPAAVAMFDRNMRYLLVSPRWLSDYNLGAQDITGRSHYDVLPGLPERWKEIHRRCLEGASEKCEEDHFNGPDGQEMWLHWEVHPWWDDRGEVGGIIIFSEVITERKRAEQAVRDSEQRFTRFMHHLPGLAWIKDLQGRYVYVNDAAEKAYNRPKAELYGKSDEQVFPPQTAAQFRQNDQRALASGTGVQVIEDLQHADGFVRHSVVNKFPIMGSNNKPMLVAGMAIDITDRLRAEEALKEADRRKDEFLAMLAHELRNPLAPIRNALQILKMPRADHEAVRQAREMMERQVQYLVRLVDDLLDVSRIMRNRIELRKERLELATVFSRAIETTQPALDARGHELGVSLPAEPIPLEGDLVRLAQVVGNLLLNAAKYSDKASRIGLIGEQEEGEVVIRVRDSGVGIDPELLPCIFDLFTQADRSLARSQGGLGIGLALVKRLVEMHGGKVIASSPGPGRGSEFVVRLPVLSPQRSSKTTGAGGEEVARAGPCRRVLVVDDNVDAAESVAMLLRLLGHEVETAHDGHTAVEAVQSFRPEVVLLDIGLPGMNGFDVAKVLRAQPENRELVLVAVTGYGQDEDRRRSHEAGFDQHLVKPVSPTTLGNLLAAPDLGAHRAARPS